MKKITVITFLLVICLAFSGCDSKNTNHDNEETTAEYMPFPVACLLFQEVSFLCQKRI